VNSYEYRHVVGFEETNLLGNVYFTNLLRWQGRCRELFLRDHAPAILDEFGRGLCLVTTRCSCEFLAELEAFDVVVVRMSLGDMTQSRLSLVFEYFRDGRAGIELVARGEQGIACLHRQGATTRAVAVPETLRRALAPFGGRRTANQLEAVR
jgi:enediyne biosynthesis thioesterase